MRTFFPLSCVSQATLLLGLYGHCCYAIQFPPPIGPYNTTLVTTKLVDYDRVDPYSADHELRTLMISVFSPASSAMCDLHDISYMDPITAAFEDSEYAYAGVLPGSVESLALKTCQKQPGSNLKPVPLVKTPAYPLILFSPGMGNSRLLYNYMAQQLASTGYVVVTVDHPYDADIVTFPDNTTIYAANITTEEQTVDDLYVRVKDISFVLDQLSQLSVSSTLLPALGTRIDFCKLGIFGHSLGGATAAQVLLSDSRFVGGFNLDGTFYGSVIEHGLTKPFAIFAHEGKNLTTDATWAALWPKLMGFKREFILNGSTHGTFTDLAEISDLVGLREKYPQQVEALLGSTLGNRASRIIASYVSSFFGFILKGEKSELLDRPSMDFPEVTIAAS